MKSLAVFVLISTLQPGMQSTDLTICHLWSRMIPVLEGRMEQKIGKLNGIGFIKPVYTTAFSDPIDFCILYRCLME